VNNTPHGLTIRFSARDDQPYLLHLEGPDVGERRGTFTPPYTPTTWAAIMRALEPGFALDTADDATRANLTSLGAADSLQSAQMW
jgi:hypothetical protein